MMSDVIDETIATYILGNKKYYDLALCVEKAMPIVRMRLTRAILEDLKGKFSDDEWKVFLADDSTLKHRALIVLRKRSWHEFASGDQETGIILARGQEDFSDLYICLHFHRKIYSNSEKSGRVFSKFKELFSNEKLFSKYNYQRAPTADKMNEGVIWEYMHNVSSIWRREDFFRRAVEKREEIVNLLAERINEMAKSVDSTMKDINSL